MVNLLMRSTFGARFLACAITALAPGIANVYAQVPNTLWELTYGGVELDVGRSVWQTFDGGFVIVGNTYSFGAGDSDVWLIRTDDEGKELWSQTFGGAASDLGYSVQQTSDGGFIIGGETMSFGNGNGDVWLIRTDDEGKELWNRTYGGAERDAGVSVEQTSDGGFVVAGRTSSFGAGKGDMWLIRTDEGGMELWNRTFGGTESDACNAVEQTSDGGFILVGDSESVAGDANVMLIRTDASGTARWTQLIGAPEDREHGNHVRQTSDGGFIIAGDVFSATTGSSDMMLTRTDDAGQIVWTRRFGGTNDEFGRAVEQTSDEGYVVVGQTSSFGAGAIDAWVVRTDETGVEHWSSTFGGARFESGYSVQQTSDGGLVILGHTTSLGAGNTDVYFIRLDAVLASPTLVINELDPATGSPDDAEFVEIVNTGRSQAQLDDYALVFYGSDQKACYSVDLRGTLDPGQTFVIGDPGVATADQLFSEGFAYEACGSGDGDDTAVDENVLVDGDAAIALYTGRATAYPQGTASGNHASTRADAVVYGNAGAGKNTALAPATCEAFFGNDAVRCTEVPADLGENSSLQRQPNGSFAPAPPTPNAPDGNLPVELIAFEALRDGDGVRLTWATASETNNAGFAVEHAPDGMLFKQVGYVEGHGTTLEARRYAFTDHDVPPGTRALAYRLKQIDFDGTFTYSPVVEVDFGVPDQFTLHDNFPNPFNPQTTIRYEIATSVHVTLEVYDLTGRLVTTLVDGPLVAGRYEARFDARDLASGLYCYRLQAGAFHAVGRMTLLR